MVSPNPIGNSQENDGELTRNLTVCVIAGEHSGDALGGKLMQALNARLPNRPNYIGVGGEKMGSEGLTSLFPLSDVAVMGPLSILPRLPRIAKRIFKTVDDVIAANPDIVIIIDSPEFTHPIAKRIRKRAPSIPILDYVSPSIWAWRSGRARKMRPYVDHVLALLPFEPEAHIRYGGPNCTYVGHPLSERQSWLENLDVADFRKRHGFDPDEHILCVLPGSRASEIRHLIEPFGATLEILKQRREKFSVAMPVVKNLKNEIIARTADWPVTPAFIEAEADKFCLFKTCRAALAASGTVTLELAMCQAPSVVAYRVDRLAARLRFLLEVHSVVLANLVLNENVYPEYLQEECRPDLLANALEKLIAGSLERDNQLKALSNMPVVMAYEGQSPSDHAAKIVCAHLPDRKN